MTPWPTWQEVRRILADYITQHDVEDDDTVPPDPDPGDEGGEGDDEFWRRMPDAFIYDDREPRWAPDTTWEVDGITFTEAEWQRYEETGERPASWPSIEEAP